MTESNILARGEAPDAERVRISLLVEPALRARIEDLAATEKRSLTGQCEDLLWRALEAQGRPEAA